MKRIWSIALSLILLSALVLSLLPVVSGAEENTLYNVTGETGRTSGEITLSDGTKTGVNYTSIQMSGHYGDDREVNVVEFDLANTHLSVEVINHGSYMVSTQVLTSAMEAYNSTHEGQQVLVGFGKRFFKPAGVSS